LLGLPKPPERIEAFDISNIQGMHAVGSMVVWEGTGMNKEAYRHFRIRTVEGANDFAMMQEVMSRRYGGETRPEEIPSPDLIVIDGGKGQLNAALDVLHDLGLSNLPIIGLAKEKEIRPAKSRVPDRIFLPGMSEPILLDVSSPAVRILQRVRDEAHRFAVSYHRKLRGKEAVLSQLDGIAGIGKARKLALLRYFGTLEGILKADVEEIRKVPRMTRTAAEEIWKALHS
jgi:excinuclease ABC subunit C